MDGLMLLEVEFTLAVQNLGAWLAPVLSWFTFLGNEEFYLVVVPFLYWCVDSAFGLRIGTMLMATSALNSAIKLVFTSPRPYWVDGRVQAYIGETSFGTPSGHSQNAAALWGLSAAKLRSKWAWPVALAVILIIGFSRVYLGVHFVRDVLAGWLIGFVLLAVFLWLEKPLVTWFRGLTTARQVLWSALSAAAILLMGLLARLVLGGWQLPPDWAANALAAYPEEAIDPLSLNAFFTAGGTWFGLLSGVAVLLRRGGLMDARGAAWKRLARYLVGLVVMVGLYAGLGALFPREPEALGLAFRFVRYALIGLWVSAVAPLLFTRLRLADWSNPSGRK